MFSILFQQQTLKRSPGSSYVRVLHHTMVQRRHLFEQAAFGWLVGSPEAVVVGTLINLVTACGQDATSSARFLHRISYKFAAIPAVATFVVQ